MRMLGSNVWVTSAAGPGVDLRAREALTRVVSRRHHRRKDRGGVVETKNVVRAWGQILTGYRPNLSIEITRECPLRCPGCYAYGDTHLGGGVVLRDLADLKGQALIDGMLRVVREQKPIHLSIVGGEPLVRFRELDVLLPQLTAMGVHTQVVTSAVRPIPPAWADMPEAAGRRLDRRPPAGTRRPARAGDVRSDPQAHRRPARHGALHADAATGPSGLRDRVHGVLGAQPGREAHLVQSLHAAEGRRVAGTSAAGGS